MLQSFKKSHIIDFFFFLFLRGKLVKLEHGKSSLLTGLISLMVY